MSTVFVRLPNHLGDACMCLPALELLAHGGDGLVLVGKPWAKALFEAYGWPVLAPRGSWVERIDALRVARAAHGARRAVLFTNSIGSALECRLAGFACAGYATEARRWLLTHAIAVPAAWTRDMHTVEYYFELARRLTGAQAQVPPKLALKLAPAAEARARASLAAAGVDGPYTMLCPAAIGLHHGRPKAWTGYPKLCTELRAHGVRVVANDSGPSHVAAAVGAPLVTIFGVTEPGRTRPWTPVADLVGGSHGWPEFDTVWERVQARLALALGVPA
jgi:heptosyltransferase-2